MIELTYVFCALLIYTWASDICLQEAADSIIRDSIKRRALYIESLLAKEVAYLKFPRSMFFNCKPWSMLERKRVKEVSSKFSWVESHHFSIPHPPDVRVFPLSTKREYDWIRPITRQVTLTNAESLNMIIQQRKEPDLNGDSIHSLKITSKMEKNRQSSFLPCTTKFLSIPV
jgi:hypothetical protein